MDASIPKTVQASKQENCARCWWASFGEQISFCFPTDGDHLISVPLSTITLFDGALIAKTDGLPSSASGVL